MGGGREGDEHGSIEADDEERALREDWTTATHRKGTWPAVLPLADLAARAWMTSPRAERDLLMFCASLRACPSCGGLGVWRWVEIGGGIGSNRIGF